MKKNFQIQCKHVFLTLIVLLNFWAPCFAQEPTILDHGGSVSSVAFSPVNPNLIASAGGQNTVKVWNLQNTTVKILEDHTDVVNSVTFSPDGKWLVSGSDDATIKVWDISHWQNIETREPITFRMPSPVPHVTFSPDSKMLAVSGRHVQLLDIINQQEIATLPHDEWVWLAAFSSDGRYLATDDHIETTVKIWDVQEKQISIILDGDTEDVNYAKFSPDNRTFASSSWGEIKLWETVSKWELLGTLQTNVASLDFSPDGKILASGGWEEVILWSAKNGEKIGTLTGHTGGKWIHGIAFSPDGTTLASGGEDGTVHIWDIESYLESYQQRGIVRLIYFLPSDRTAQPDIDAKMDAFIKEAQLAYAEIMERHGFGRKTFKYETDVNGKAVVHHVVGQFTDQHYNNLSDTWDMWEEIRQQFDTSTNIYITAIDISNEILDGSDVCGRGGPRGASGGMVLVPASGDCFNVDVIAHELGHAFGLQHDYRTNPKRVLSSHTADEMIRSFCAAEWLDAHSYFNTHETGFNEVTTIEMSPPQSVPSDDIRLRFEVTDPDGLHQAQLLTPEEESEELYFQLIVCKHLNGTSSTVEFVVSKTIFRQGGEVALQVMDQEGVFSVENFYPQAGPKIEGPWVWVIVPTGVDGSAAATSEIDYLAKASGDAVTEKQVATNGARIGGAIGDKVWTPGNIAPTGNDNITELVNAIGLAEGDIDNHVAYGSIALDASRTQKTRMYIGSDDAVKVWLNGELVHNNPVDRPAYNYQDQFPVTLKKGKNILLVAVYEGWGEWSGFFGFAADAEYTLTLPTAEAARPAWDVNEDGITDATDATLVTAALGQQQPKNPRLDVNGDGVVDGKDLALVAEHLGEGDAPAAPSSPALPLGFTLDTVEHALNILRAADDGTLTFKRGIDTLERLLARFVPENTALLHNYPNPFNPETWIPYQLSQPTEVTLHIYAVNGALVRTLALGHQPAGIYHGKSRAAYWDGRNVQGERVASGVYFYTLTTGDFTATRKLLIRK